MKYITTYSGEDFSPIHPNINQIKIEDIAHALSMMCRANGHFNHFFSVAQHSINCAIEAKARGFSRKLQLACLLHDASEAYISDITRPVKSELFEYCSIEKQLQDLIYEKFLYGTLTADEQATVKQIDDDMLVCEFNTLMEKTVFEYNPIIKSNLNFDFRMFSEVENEFLCLFYDQLDNSQEQNPKEFICQIEEKLVSKGKQEVVNILRINNVTHSLFKSKQEIKKLSAQIDVWIHAYGILLTLPEILSKDEKILSLSLGAGNTGKDFDLETTERIAEYKFVNWSGKSDTIRENNLFKDFVELVHAKTDKHKFIYCYDVDIVKKFLESKRSLESVLHRSNFKDKFKKTYGEKYKTVHDFYSDYKHDVCFIDLQKLLF